MNLLSLVQETSRQYGLYVPTTFAQASETEYMLIQIQLNNVLRDLFYNPNFKFRERETTFNLVVGQREYTNTYGIIKKDGLWVEDLTYPLVYENNDYYYINNTATGTPESYKIYNDKIKMYPIPNAVLSVTVLYETQNIATTVAGVEKSSMTLETDLPNFDSKFHDVLIYGALARMFGNDNESAAKYQALFINAEANLLSEAKGSRDAQPRFVIDSRNDTRLSNIYNNLYRRNY